MWPFKRKYPDRRELQVADSWSLSQGSHDGHPLIVRVNRGVAEAVGHPAFAHQVGVAFPLHSPDANGFPGAEETEQLDEIEELVVARLGADRQCLHVATLSTGGMRELVFYSSDPAATDAALGELAGEVRTHELQHIIQPDPKWRVYRQFA